MFHLERMSKGLLPSVVLLSRMLCLQGLVWPYRNKALRRATNQRLMAATTVNKQASEAAKGKILVLGGTGFLGQEVCQRAVAEGYSVTSLSRRGLPPVLDSRDSTNQIDYRQGDACNIDSIKNILREDGYTAVVHCIGLLFDDASGLGKYNTLVSGSGSVPDAGSTYDRITRRTAFNAIDAAKEYAAHKKRDSMPFVFTSAAEAGWPDVPFGESIENYLAPEWLRRYLKAKREVEGKLNESGDALRSIIFRPSLIYSMDRPASFLPVGAFFVGNAVGLPFVDRPVTVASLATAILKAISNPSTKGVLRFQQIDELSKT